MSIRKCKVITTIILNLSIVFIVNQNIYFSLYNSIFKITVIDEHTKFQFN